MASTQRLTEVARSASEASKISLLDHIDLTRYQNPPADTCYPLEYVFYLLGDVQDKLVVDLGCGSGEEVVPLRQRGARVIGIDISPHLIAVAHERLQKYGVDAELLVGSAYETDLANESADVVFCMSLLHHLELDLVKKEILRILKPQGLLILKEPIRFSRAMTELRRLFPPAEDVSESEYPLNSKQLNAFADGFQVLSSRSFRTPLIPLLTRIIRMPKLEQHMWSSDAWVLRHFPALADFATVRVMALRKNVIGGLVGSHDQSGQELPDP